MSFHPVIGLSALLALVACSSEVTSKGSSSSSSATGTGGQTSVGGNGAGGAATGGAEATGGGEETGGGGAGGGVGGGGGAGGDLGCAGEPDNNACQACCVQTHPAGFATFNVAFNACGCFGTQFCYGTCSMSNSLCGPDGPPVDDCTACAMSALTADGDCTSDAAFMAGCEQDPGCSAYLACFQSCP